MIGSARLILLGDLYQLQPADHQYFFTCAAWKTRKSIRTWSLNSVLRITSDEEDKEELMFFLDSIRTGSFYTSDRARSLLDYVFAAKKPAPSTLVVCPTREIAATINTSRLNEIDGDGPFRVGCRVQVTKNIYTNRKIVAANGSLGTVVSVESRSLTVLLDNTNEITAHPKHFRLGYAVTVHGAQGLSLDCIHIVGPNLFEGRQHLYTAFSRARSLHGISVSNLSSFDIDDLPHELPRPLTSFVETLQ